VEQINIHAAKTQLSALIEKAAAGQPFVIAKAGRPLVTVWPYQAPAHPPRIGFLRGAVLIPDDFDRMGREEIAAMFGGKR